MIFYGKQSVNKEDIDAVTEVLRSDFLTQGHKVAEFEKGLSDYCDVDYVKTVCNATAALHLAYLSIGLQKGDVVWTVPNTFVATASAALYCGAEVDFVDIDPKTYNMSIKCLEEKLSSSKKEGKLPKLVVPVHFAGQSCEMEDIWKLSQKYGFKVIEDASHALGGKYKGSKIGCCKYSNMTVFSFHPVKMITTGEGGAIATNDAQLDKKVALLRSHGITKSRTELIGNMDGDWYYEQQQLGFNYRLTDIQSALGISQLKRLDDFVKKRQMIAERYLNDLKSVELPYQHPDSESSWHLFVIKTNRRDKTYHTLRSQGIMTQVHYIPVNKQPLFNREGLPNSDNYYKKCLSLPIYYDLDDDMQSRVISGIL